MTQKIINNENIAQINCRLGQNSLYLIIERPLLVKSKYDHRVVECFDLEGMILLEIVLIIGLLCFPMILNFLKTTNLSLTTSLNETRCWPPASYKYCIN